MDVSTASRTSGTVTRYGTVLLDVLANADDDAARGLVRRYVAPIKDSSHLIDTLDALADSDMSIRGAAARLHVHPNTVIYRLARIRERTGFDPRHVRDLVAFLLALRSRVD
jgi:DNA-binding PucR family transcriptional regulator